MGQASQVTDFTQVSLLSFADLTYFMGHLDKQFSLRSIYGDEL
jgi:hypothetical protein